MSPQINFVYSKLTVLRKTAKQHTQMSHKMQLNRVSQQVIYWTNKTNELQ